jgi:hypothetical protein
MSTKTRLIIVASAILIVAVLVIVGAVTKAQTSQTNAQVVILNLLNGQQYFGAPHIYQGDYNGKPTNQWPVYYGPNNASQYWSLAGIKSSNQPVLELAPAAQTFSAGAMFWSETYIGGPVKITIIGTQTSTSSPVANGFVIYLFLKPTMWGISPQYNYTIPYNSTAGEGWLIAPSYPSPAEGDVIYPQSSTSYLIIQWDPWWQTAATQSGATGQWNVWIVSNPSGNNPSISPNPSPNLGSGYAGWDGIGTGAFQPNPGDRINITVTYDPSTNTLTGIAIDLNTGQSASFTLNLNGYYTPPSSSNYVFGVGGAGAKGSYWALLYVAMTTSIKPSPLTTSTTTPATVTVTTTSIVTSTVTSPVTTTVTSTTTFTVTTTSPVTVTTTVFTTSSIIQTVIIALIIIIVVLAAALVAITIRRR